MALTSGVEAMRSPIRIRPGSIAFDRCSFGPVWLSAGAVPKAGLNFLAKMSTVLFRLSYPEGPLPREPRPWRHNYSRNVGDDCTIERRRRDGGCRFLQPKTFAALRLRVRKNNWAHAGGKRLTRRHGEDQEGNWELNSVNNRPTSERKTSLHHREITEKKIDPL